MVGIGVGGVGLAAATARTGSVFRHCAFSEIYKKVQNPTFSVIFSVCAKE